MNWGTYFMSSLLNRTKCRHIWYKLSVPLRIDLWSSFHSFVPLFQCPIWENKRASGYCWGKKCLSYILIYWEQMWVLFISHKYSTLIVTVAQRLNMRIICLWGFTFTFSFFTFCVSSFRRLLIQLCFSILLTQTTHVEHWNMRTSSGLGAEIAQPLPFDSLSCWEAETCTQPGLRAEGPYGLSARLKPPLIWLNGAVLSCCPN